jgi:transcriptional regulator with XRE-family HTH domain
MELGEFIKRVRLQKGWMVKDLAEKCGLSASQISRIENGHSTEPRLENLRAIARALDVPEEVLLSKTRINDYIHDQEKKENKRKEFDEEIVVDAYEILEMLKPFTKKDQLELVQAIKWMIRGRKLNYRPKD